MMKRIITLVGMLLMSWVGNLSAEEAVCKTTSFAVNAFANNLDAKAVNCLDYLIDKEPGNGDAHFLKGKYCLNIGDYKCAQQRFTASSAIAKHKAEITELTKTAFRAQFASGNVTAAETLYSMVPGFNSQEACKKFLADGTATNPENGFMSYKLSQAFCGSVNNQTIGNRFLELASSKPLHQRRSILDKAAEFISWNEINKVFPAPFEKTVFEKTYVGQGTTDNDVIRSVTFGKELQNGDTVYIEGSHFWVFTNGKWSECRAWTKLSDLHFDGDGYIPIGADKGVEMTVKVIRTVRSY